MAHTRAWSNIVPSDGEAASLGASRIRDFRVDVDERMALDHVWNTSLTEDGLHNKVSLKEQASDPTNVANFGIVYTKDVGTITELHYIDSAGTVTKLTNNAFAVSPIKLPVESADPTNAANTGFVYGKDVSAKIELFWEDEDGNVVQLTSGGKSILLTTNNTWEKGNAVNEVALTDAATITVDASLSNMFRVTLADNRTLAVPTNGKDGQIISIRFIQDATGTRTLTLNASYNKASGLDLTLSTAASAEDLISFVFLNSVWRAISIQKAITSAV